MNCQRLHLLLDSREKRDLGADTKLAIERHIAICASCRNAWAAFDAVVRVRIPEAPRALRERTAEALGIGPTRSRRRRRGSLLVGSVLIAGAALAAAYSFHTDVSTREGASGNGPVARVPDDSSRPGTSSERGSESLPDAISAPDRAERPQSTELDASDEMHASDPSSSALSLDPRSIVVVVSPNTDASSEALEAFGVCSELVLESLYGLPGVNVIADDRVAAYQRVQTEPLDIARGLGAGVLVDLHMPSEASSCIALVVDAATGRLIDGFGGVLPPVDSSRLLRSLAEDFAQAVANTLFDDDESRVAEARARLFDTDVPDANRVAAILSLRESFAIPLEDLFDASIKATLIQIAMTSSDAAARANAVLAMRGQTDPDLIDVLLYVLENDKHEDARRGAAYALHYFAGDDRVTSALTRAIGDRAAARSHACCTQTVGEAAERSLSDDDTVISMTLDRFISDASDNLTDPERLRILTTSPDGRAQFPFALPADVASMVHQIGVRAAESELRRTAWMLLAYAEPRADVGLTLLEDVLAHPNAGVRRSAAITLVRHVEHPDVRRSIGDALSAQRSPEIRRTLSLVLTQTDAREALSLD